MSGVFFRTKSFCTAALRHSFLEQQVAVIDPKRSKFLIRSVDVEQQPAEGNIDLTISKFN